MNVKELFKKYSKCDLFAFSAFILSLLMSVIDVIRYAALGEITTFTVMLAVNLCLCLIVLLGFTLRLSGLGAAVGIIYFIIGCNTNYAGMPLFNFTFFVQAAVLFAGGVAALVFQIKDKLKPRLFRIPVIAATAAVLLFCVIFGGVNISNANGRDYCGREIWAVPDIFDKADCPEKGTLSAIEYKTKAYATDNREVTKKAWVYLPYGYTEENEYDILYLMHGTGDDEEYWLKTYGYNKTMVDNMIHRKIIKPLIIVTPSFYTENDCADNLDELTYSFKDELRNDLMPLIESTYSTYAADTTDEGFINSRNHRAFAGLSRGAVTTLHSALCGSLDYFSYFGVFSGSRTDIDYYGKTAMSDEFKVLPINYLYVSSGSFDFPLSGQIKEYREFLKADSRLKQNVNTCFDVFPLCKHAISCWHLALYNFLPYFVGI